MRENYLSNQTEKNFSLWISGQIMKGILLEVSCFNKPGLVGPESPGIHQDMNFSLFMKSSAAISPFYPLFVDLGLKMAQEPTQILSPLKKIGLQAEKAMFTATNGVNTQKGLIFSSALLAAAVGIQFTLAQNKITTDKIFESIANITQGIVIRELEPLKKKQTKKMTNGEKLYLERGITGIRGEAEKGFPSAKRAYKFIKQEMKKQRKLNDILLEALFLIISELDDTTILIKSHEKASWSKDKAKIFLEKGGMARKEGFSILEKLNSQFIKQKISPGGAADMLSCAISVFLIEEEMSSFFDLT
ncbi:MAG: triphosphoribosyl-dephospho-CoA synthase [Candidatus Kariarchaeaceae archaeon]